MNDISFSSGKLQLTNQKDLYYLPYWNMAFTSDCGMGVIDVPNATEKVKKLLYDKTLYIWEDDIPVSQAAFIKFIWNFPKSSGRRNKERLSRYKDKSIIVFCKRSEVMKYLRELRL